VVERQARTWPDVLLAGVHKSGIDQRARGDRKAQDRAAGPKRLFERWAIRKCLINVGIGTHVGGMP